MIAHYPEMENLSRMQTYMYSSYHIQHTLLGRHSSAGIKIIKGEEKDPSQIP